MADWIRKPGTSTHPLIATLQDANGPVDLPVGSTGTIRAKRPSDLTPKISGAVTVINAGAAAGDPNRGRVSYTFSPADLDTPGVYQVDFLMNISGVGTQVFPENSYSVLLILPGADTV